MPRRHGPRGRCLWALALGLACLGPAAAAEASGRHPHAKHRHAHPHPEAAPRARPPPPPPPAAEEEVEVIEQVEPSAPAGQPAAAGQVATAGSTGAAGGRPWSQWVAHLHPALVHLPIGWLVLWCLAELAAGRRRAAALAAAAGPLGWLTLLSFVPATVTGLLHVAELPQDPASLRPVLAHRNAMLVAALACLALAGWQAASRTVRQGSGWPRRAYLGGLLLTLAVVAVSAHWGGQLVYGDDYLPF